MGRGYTFSFANEIQEISGRGVAISNDSMGNTFSHFGLYKAKTARRHATADVVVVEYAINDQELLKHSGHLHWRRAFEGLLRLIRKDNRKSVLVVCILYPEGKIYSDASWRMAELMKRIGLHYDAVIFDARDELEGLEHIADEPMFRDPAHYTQNYQDIIGKLLARKVFGELDGVYEKTLRTPLFNHDYSAAKALVWADNGISFDKSLQVFLQNSRSSQECVKIFPGHPIRFKLHGELVCLITAATKTDGILRITFGSIVIFVSAYRRALLPPNDEKWPFLVTNIVPAQALGRPLKSVQDYVDVEISLLTVDEEASLDKTLIFKRGSSAEPPVIGGARCMHLVDLVVVGKVKLADAPEVVNDAPLKPEEHDNGVRECRA